MSKYPAIDRHCPLKQDLPAWMKGDFCRYCKRQVHNLSAMSDQERSTFLAQCEGEVCVTYTIPLKKLTQHIRKTAVVATVAISANAAVAQDALEEFIIVGGTTQASVKAALDNNKEDVDELPTVYEIADAEVQLDSPLESTALIATDKVQTSE